MKTSIHTNNSKMGITPIRMGIGDAQLFVNRKSKTVFLKWVEDMNITTYRKGARQDREYLTQDLIDAVNAECLSQ